MKVYQTEFGRGGNCFAACLATELDLPLDAVPDLRRIPKWGPALVEWVGDRREVEFVYGDGLPLWRQKWVPTCPAILGHRLLNGEIHAALFRDGTLYHDPSPRPFCRPEAAVLLWTLLKVKGT